ncbi:tyrosine-type recombinase/integrase [Pedobacter cryotolerans]|uniref:Site-specific integrase n=1 Tax=Pedobacter cryotolerans TaxID=2571270 RepID=A0A4V5NZA2_9SPHI|nr:site-specific integrase [Pedobacter cryotolerans]TKB96112.1 site-specific integrase [Pedobacter cryotolerans]
MAKSSPTFTLDPEYSGKALNLNIFPNKATTHEKKFELLVQLRTELANRIKTNNYPLKKTETEEVHQKPKHTVEQVLRMALDAKLKMKLSNRYKDDLTLVHRQFISFLTEQELNQPFDQIQVIKLEEFLSRYNSSGTYYMKKRSDLSILFSSGGKLTGNRSIARDTHTERAKAKLHTAYDKQKMKKLLAYLKEVSPTLHLCCLFTYGCWLRPHVEVLSLSKKQFKNDNTEIHLSGSENKGGKVRIVYVPDYVRTELETIIERLDDDVNIFSGTVEVLNRFYFTTQWKRLRIEMLEKKLIEDGQTIYSFRHTAAVEVYRRTKDIYLLQKLMGHSSITVTQKYLRSLGVVDIEEMKNFAPTL